jgi:hypothetical protein
MRELTGDPPLSFEEFEALLEHSLSASMLPLEK